MDDFSIGDTIVFAPFSGGQFDVNVTSVELDLFPDRSTFTGVIVADGTAEDGKAVFGYGHQILAVK